MNLTQHPLSAAFPPMTEEEFRSLVEDIRANGQQKPIIVIGSEVIDGWHRYSACVELAVEPVIEEFVCDDPAAYVISSNLHRRHLTAGQRAAAVVACHEWNSAQEPAIFTPHPEPAKPASEAVAAMAERAGVSPRMIERAKRVQKADPDAAKEVIAGRVSLNRAAAEVANENVGGSAPSSRVKAVVSAIPRESEIEKLQAELAAAHERIEELEQTCQELADAAEILSQMDDGRELIEQLKASKAYARSVEAARNQYMQENAKIIREVKALRRKYEGN